MNVPAFVITIADPQIVIGDPGFSIFGGVSGSVGPISVPIDIGGGPGFGSTTSTPSSGFFNTGAGGNSGFGNSGIGNSGFQNVSSGSRVIQGGPTSEAWNPVSATWVIRSRAI